MTDKPGAGEKKPQYDDLKRLFELAGQGDSSLEGVFRSTLDRLRREHAGGNIGLPELTLEMEDGTGPDSNVPAIASPLPHTGDKKRAKEAFSGIPLLFTGEADSPEPPIARKRPTSWKLLMAAALALSVVSIGVLLLVVMAQGGVLGGRVAGPSPRTRIEFAGRLSAPNGALLRDASLAVDSQGNLYVVDSRLHKVIKYGSKGEVLAEWGHYGRDATGMSYPGGIGVDSSGFVFVSDTANNRLQKYDGGGRLLETWTQQGSGDDRFSSPKGIALDEQGNLYIVDSKLALVQKFDRAGNVLNRWGGTGAGQGQFDEPAGIAVDRAGNVYVVDSGHNRVQKFDGQGAFLASFGKAGQGEGEFNAPQGIALDGSGNIYVTDTGNHRVQKFDSAGKFLQSWGSQGQGDGQFQEPAGIAVDREGNIYVADGKNGYIQKFRQI